MWLVLSPFDMLWMLPSFSLVYVVARFLSSIGDRADKGDDIPQQSEEDGQLVLVGV